MVSVVVAGWWHWWWCVVATGTAQDESLLPATNLRKCCLQLNYAVLLREYEHLTGRFNGYVLKVIYSSNPSHTHY
eukprot:769165-Pleurochrysis_carterae.AAC.3